MEPDDLAQNGTNAHADDQFNLVAWEPLSDVQIEAARMRANGTSVDVIVERLNVGRRTLYRWEHEQAYQSLVLKLRADLMASLEPKLAELMHLAAEVLSQALAGNIPGDDPRVALARGISRDTSFRILRARASVAAAAANGDEPEGRGRPAVIVRGR